MDAITIVIYNVVLTICVSLGVFYDKSKDRIFLYIIVLLLFIFCGLRYYVGNDYENYIDTFNTIKSGYDSYVEPGFYILNKAFASLPDGHFFVFAVISFATILLYVRMLVKFDIVALGMFFFFTAEYIFFINDIIRQGFTIAMFLNSIILLRNNNVIKYTISTLSSIAIHYSAVVLLLCSFIKRVRLNNYVWAVIMTIAGILYKLGFFKAVFPQLIALIPYYGERYSRIHDGVYMEEVELGSGLGVLFKYITYVFVALNGKKMASDIIFNFFMIGCVLNFVFLDFFLPLRIVEYLLYLKLIVYCVMIRSYWRIQTSVVFLCIHLIYFEYLVFTAGGKHGGFPYDNILFYF